VGKVRTDALVADIMPSLDAMLHIEKHAEKDLRSQKMKTPFLLMGKKSSVEYMPMGTVLVISPWNYPFLLSLSPMLSALAAGNTVILKPSEITPAVGKLIESLVEKANFPPNVVQVAHGGKELGASLTNVKPDYIFFTGSVATGKIIQQTAAKDLIPTTLELGGKDPMIVLRDANLKRAAEGAAWGAFTNSGQVCMSVERLIIEEEVMEPFIEELLPIVSKLKQGAGPEDDIVSMASRMQIEIVKKQVGEAIEQGARLLAGEHPSDWDPNSMYIKPMVLIDVREDMAIMQEETFGPVLPIMAVHGEDEAVRMANRSRYGLNASVWSENKEKARRVSSRLQSGAVLINDVLITVANNHLPFGGQKESGVGRYHGENGIRMFCHEKAVMEDLGYKKSEIQWYPYKGKYDSFRDLLVANFGGSKSLSKVLKEYLKLIRMKK
ncbi:aldehyde dehydrogenase family protein, partial [Pradoshia sp.]